MQRIIKAAIVVASAVGVSAVMAQSVERDGKVVSKPTPQTTVAQAQTAAPIQTAQAGAAAGGASGGASTATVAGSFGATATATGAAVFVGTGLAVIAVSAAGADPTVSH